MPDDPLEYLFSLQHFGIKLGLHNIHALVEALGHPERTYASVLVAGTNGKGSVVAMTDAAARAGGHRTGRYTSPHLVDLNERFVIDGHAVSDRDLLEGVSTIRKAADRLLRQGILPSPPTFFEVTTATAFELFRRAGVRLAVCEVGMGGRLDATNVLEPEVTAITSIGLDHQEHLGGTLGEIAMEKAGIIKPGVPLVLGDVPDEARPCILDVARTRGAPVVDARSRETPAVDTSLRIRTGKHDYGSVTLALRGAHQVGNALVAVHVLESLDERGVPIGPDAIVAGLTSAHWPGRLEHRRFPDGRDLLMDAAHNHDGARTLASYLRATYAHPPPLVFATMRDKNAGAMLRALTPVVGAVFVTRASTERSADPETLGSLARAIAPRLPVEVHETPAAALAAAWSVSSRVVIAGSIYLLGDVIKMLRRS